MRAGLSTVTPGTGSPFPPEEWADPAVESRARVWRLYMAGSALAFETGKLGVNQVLSQRPGGEPPPLRRTDWI